MVAYFPIMTKINTDRFINYLKSNGYKPDEYDRYALKLEEDGKTIRYFSFDDKYILTKSIFQMNEDYSTINIKLNYCSDGSIDIELMYTSVKDGKNAILSQSGTYENNDLKDCKVISNNNFNTMCADMRKEAKIFDGEVKKIIEENDLNMKYVKNNK